MRIGFRTTAGTTFYLDLQPTMTIAEIKDIIERQHKLPSTQTRLVLDAKFLDNSVGIGTISIPANSYIIVYTATSCDTRGAPPTVRRSTRPPRPLPQDPRPSEGGEPPTAPAPQAAEGARFGELQDYFDKLTPEQQNAVNQLTDAGDPVEILQLYIDCGLDADRVAELLS
jgi:hypothetical protein